MNIREKMVAASNTLKYGEQLANPATWKQRTVRITAIVGVLVNALPFISAFGEMQPNELRDAAVLISNGVDGVLLLFNAYMHYATSSKVGFARAGQLQD